jgi:hypothetical protein
VNEHLLAEANRDAIAAHNPDLVTTTTKVTGKASYTSYDFNSDEERRVLGETLAQSPTPESLTVHDLTKVVYGNDDEALKRRVRSALSYGSRFQKELPNGTAYVARKDGTLRITKTPDEFGDLVEENTAVKTAAVTKLVRQRTARISKDLDSAVDKVPALGQRLGEVRAEVKTTLESSFSRQLALLQGDD